MRTILCYGDSNTWGATPSTLVRFPMEQRWTGVAARELGAAYQIIEDGINGRTTIWDDPENLCRNGLSSLGYSMYRSKPLDLVVLMLGTNDLAFTDAKGYYSGISVIADRILQANKCYPGTSEIFTDAPRLLLISPIRLCDFFPHYEESEKFALYTERLAEELGIPWIDAAKYGEPSELDGCHMDEQSHARLGEAVAKKIIEIFEGKL